MWAKQQKEFLGSFSRLHPNTVKQVISLLFSGKNIFPDPRKLVYVETQSVNQCVYIYIFYFFLDNHQSVYN